MKFDWHTIGTIIVTVIAVGGVMVALLRGFFMTPKKCNEVQHMCQGNICKKIDELKIDSKEHEAVANERYAEIKGALGRIEGKLSND